MGNRNVRTKGSNLANYGAGYDPYDKYDGIQNYGSAYRPIGGGYVLGYGYTSTPIMTTTTSPLYGYGQQGLREYGGIYPAGFNAALDPAFNGPKIRMIYVPNSVANALQNLIQQNGVGGIGNFNPMMSGFGGMNPMIGGIGGMNSMGGFGGVNPMIGGIGGMNSMGGFGGVNPMLGGFGGFGSGSPMLGGIGNYGPAQLMSQGPGVSPYYPQMPFSQMNPYCNSMSFQVPSMGPQLPYPMPCPPPMIQPVMPQNFMRKQLKLNEI